MTPIAFQQTKQNYPPFTKTKQKKEEAQPPHALFPNCKPTREQHRKGTVPQPAGITQRLVPVLAVGSLFLVLGKQTESIDGSPKEQPRRETRYGLVRRNDVYVRALKRSSPGSYGVFFFPLKRIGLAMSRRSCSTTKGARGRAK